MLRHSMASCRHCNNLLNMVTLLQPLRDGSNDGPVGCKVCALPLKCCIRGLFGASILLSCCLNIDALQTWRAMKHIL